ncbi:acetolactate decarboxylase [Tenacibaculum dicentrarchi]|uniref:acetolactate decarboxylase n=1 Tax=Tenacibaculum dicentrarchi TaxID=669041 RepID=UPI000C7E06A3|nr:Alpha-acetolactate decarboxylase [Tenacibaculum dicentrarchi]
MRKTGVLLIYILFFYSCQNKKKTIKCTVHSHQKSIDKITHYSTIDAMRNGVYKGDLTISQLTNKGDFGLGTYNNLDGEMVVLDGVFYRVKSNGEVVIANKYKKTPFNSLTFFNTDFEQKIVATNLSNLKKQIVKILPSKNKMYAIKAEVSLNYIKLGGAEKIENNDYRPIAKILEKRPIYTSKNITGTIVGFYYPSTFSDIDLHPFHFHFISTNKNIAGHIIEAEFKEVQLFFDEKESIEILIPDTKEYNRVWDNQNKIKLESNYN